MNNQTEIFTDNGLNIIFEGSILTNSQGEKQAIGYRLENPLSENCPIYSRSPKDNNGIYNANGFINGIKRRSKGKKGVFFPSDWTRQQVIKAIAEAYATKEIKSGQNLILGTSANGLKIRLWLDENGKVFDAMPIMTNQFESVPKKPKRKNACKSCGHPKHSICLNHNSLPNPKITELILKRVRYHTRKLYFNFARRLKFVE